MSDLVPMSNTMALSAPGSGFAATDAFSHGNPPQFGPHDFLRLIKRYRGMLIAVVGLITGATFAWQMLSPNVYSSTANIQVELIDAVGLNQADIQARNVQRIANEVKIYRSRSVAERVAKDLTPGELALVLKDQGITPSSNRGADIEKATGALMTNMTKIESEEGSDLIEVSGIAHDPELAAKIANRFPKAVRELKNSMASSRKDGLLVSLEEERKNREQQALVTAQQLANYRLQRSMLNGAGSVEDLQQINRIATEAASAAAMRSGTAAQSAGVSQAAQMRTTANASSPVLEALQRQEADLSAQYANLSQTYGSGHPDVVRLTGQLEEVRAAMTRERYKALAVASAVGDADAARMTALAQSDAAREAARASHLESVVSKLTGEARNHIADTAKLDELDRAAQQAAKAYNEISDRISQVSSQMMVEGVNSAVVSPAVPDYNRVSPSPLKMTVLALLGSSIIGLLLVFSREIVDDRLRTIAQIRKLFGLPTFGMLPFLNDGISEKLDESPVIADPQSLFAEVARSVFVEVRDLAEGAASQSVLITSPLPGDGKSVVTLTIAAAAVAMGKRVVILDLDLRKASILQDVQRNMHSPELMDVLMGKVDLNRIEVQAPQSEYVPSEKTKGPDEHEEAVPSPTGRLMLLSSTQPVAEPAALLTSGRIQTLIASLKEQYDLVLINAPAALAVRDARTMCEFTDHAVAVVRWGHTTVDQMSAMLELLGTDNIDGVVFDQVDYAEHARRRYGDSIEFYMASSDYFTPPVRRRRGPISALRRKFHRKPDYGMAA